MDAIRDFLIAAALYLGVFLLAFATGDYIGWLVR